MKGKLIDNRFFLLLVLMFVLIASWGVGLFKKPVGESLNEPLSVCLSETQPQSSPESFSVEKLNSQVQIKQLRQALLDEPLSANKGEGFGDDIDREIESVEQALQQLTATN